MSYFTQGVVEPQCLCGPESTPFDFLHVVREGCHQCGAYAKFVTSSKPADYNPVHGSMQMILLTTWSWIPSKMDIPSHPGVSLNSGCNHIF